MSVNVSTEFKSLEINLLASIKNSSLHSTAAISGRKESRFRSLLLSPRYWSVLSCRARILLRSTPPVGSFIVCSNRISSSSSLAGSSKEYFGMSSSSSCSEPKESRRHLFDVRHFLDEVYSLYSCWDCFLDCPAYWSDLHHWTNCKCYYCSETYDTNMMRQYRYTKIIITASKEKITEPTEGARKTKIWQVCRFVWSIDWLLNVI